MIDGNVEYDADGNGLWPMHGGLRMEQVRQMIYEANDLLDQAYETREGDMDRLTAVIAGAGRALLALALVQAPTE